MTTCPVSSILYAFCVILPTPIIAGCFLDVPALAIIGIKLFAPDKVSSIGLAKGVDATSDTRRGQTGPYTSFTRLFAGKTVLAQGGIFRQGRGSRILG